MYINVKNLEMASGIHVIGNGRGLKGHTWDGHKTTTKAHECVETGSRNRTQLDDEEIMI